MLSSASQEQTEPSLSTQVALPVTSSLLHLKYDRQTRLLASEWYLACHSAQERRTLITNLYNQPHDQAHLRQCDQIKAHFETWGYTYKEDPAPQAHKAALDYGSFSEEMAALGKKQVRTQTKMPEIDYSAPHMGTSRAPTDK